MNPRPSCTWVQDAGCKPAASLELKATGCKPQVAGCKPRCVYWLQAAGCSPLASSRLGQAACHCNNHCSSPRDHTQDLLAYKWLLTCPGCKPFVCPGCKPPGWRREPRTAKSEAITAIRNANLGSAITRRVGLTWKNHIKTCIAKTCIVCTSMHTQTMARVQLISTQRISHIAFLTCVSCSRKEKCRSWPTQKHRHCRRGICLASLHHAIRAHRHRRSETQN